MGRTDRSIAWGLLTFALMGSPECPTRADEGDLVFKGGTVIDGTGAPRRRADVAVRGDRIIAVGAIEPGPGMKVIDAEGLIIAPGFIDLHTHSDDGIVRPRTRRNVNYLTQGVTTIVTGNCGGGAIDAARYFAAIDAHGAGTNVIHLIPHGEVRAAVLGHANRSPSPVDLKRMKRLVERDMKAGAWGMSTGLIYVPSLYARTDELIELAKVVRQFGGIYASHIRDEGAGLLASVDEAIAVGDGAGVPVHISHLKVTGRRSWGLVRAAIERIDAARAAGKAVSADQYPYIASSTRLAAMVVPPWAARVDGATFARLAADPLRGPELRRAIAEALDARDGGSAVRIARYAARPEWNGLDLSTIAEQTGSTPLDVILEIQRHGGAQAIGFVMCEPDVREVMRHPFVATASDGATHLPGQGDRPHPRSYGTFPRKIRYALDDKVLSLEQAIRSSSGWPAEILGLIDRGVIRLGAYADLVVFDPKTFRDAATFEEPTRYAPGVRHLLVNGIRMIADGQVLSKPMPAGKLPGRALRLHRDGPAERIIKVGRIWTGDDQRPWAEAMAIRGGQLAAVGSSAEVERFRGYATQTIERPDAFAIPGLIDAHGHMTSLGTTRDEIDLRGVASLDEVAHRVKERLERTPGDSWLKGRNWDQSLWPGGAFPTSAVLDAISPHRPVWLRRVDGHAGWANGEAMRRAKVTKETEAPSDGQILRDSEGRLTGVFIDGAMDLIDRAVPDPTPQDIRRRLLAAQEMALAAGLTGIHDAGVSKSVAQVYRALDREGLLKLRIHAMALPPSGGEIAFVRRRPPASVEDARFEMRAIKLFIDGALGSRGGLLFKPYSDDPGNSGLRLIDPRVLEATTTEALRHGWQVATHAIGDKGNALVIDAYAAALKAVPKARDPRLRIEHAQVIRKQDIVRFAELGIIASMQPSHAIDDMRWAEARLGPDRVDGAYAWRWFADADVRLAFGSDFPVEIVNPFWGLYAAITRQDAHGHPSGGWHPDQRLTLEAALRAHTAGSAFASFAEGRVGMLRPGYRADVTLVDRDPFRVSPLELLDTRVIMTLIDGEVVFKATR